MYHKKKHFTTQQGKTQHPLNATTPLFVFVGLCCACIWVLLWIRIGYLQLVSESTLAPRARRQQTTLASITGKRGEIVDRNNNVLARSVAMQTISVTPRTITHKREAAKQLSKIIKKPEKEILQTLQESRGTILLARKVSQDIAEQIRKAKIPGVTVITEYGRIYPYKDVAGILLGFVGDDNVGLEGIEYAMNDRLKGRVEQQKILRDARGKKLSLNDTLDPEELEGETITLTIDMHIQYIAEEAIEHVLVKHKAKWAGALVVEVATGDILAWAEVPRFNPNNFKNAKPKDWKNRLATDAHEPGSIFKPFLIASALEEEIVNPNSLIFCEGGVWKINDTTTIHDDTGKFQWLSLSDVLAKSSNIGMAKIGLSLGIQRYLPYIQRFGFGSITSLPIPQSPGIARFDRYWSDVDVATLAFGQGIAVTGVQLAQAALVLANDGVFQPLRLFVDQKDTTYPYRIISEKNVKITRNILRDAIKNGTGKRADIANIEIGGKTGTAQKAQDGTYGTERFASFIGMFPIQQPEYLIIVLVDEPQKISIYGSVVAIPAFKEIAERIIAYKNIHTGTAVQNSITKTSDVVPTTTKTQRVIRKPIIHANASQFTTMPNVQGMHLRNAIETLSQLSIIPSVYGKSGIVIKQTPPPGTPIQRIKNATLWLSTQE